MDLLVPMDRLEYLACLDRRDTAVFLDELVPTESKAKMVRRDLLELLDPSAPQGLAELEVHLEREDVMALPAPLVHEVTTASQVAPVNLAPLDRLDHLDFLELLEQRVTEDHLVPMATTALLVPLDRTDFREHRVLWDNQVSAEKTDLRDPRERGDPSVRLDRQDSQDPSELQELQEPQDCQDLKERTVATDKMAPQVTLAPRETLVPPEREVSPVCPVWKESGDPTVMLDLPELLDLKAKGEPQDSEDCPAALASQDPTAKMANVAFPANAAQLAVRVLQVNLVPPVQQDNEDPKDCPVSQDPPVSVVLRVTTA